MQRADTPEEERVDFSLYVEEFHNFTTEAFAAMLSEIRKYGLALTLANQYLDQLTHEIRTAIVGNVGSLIAFRVGPTEAGHLSRELHPYSPEALASFPRTRRMLSPSTRSACLIRARFAWHHR